MFFIFCVTSIIATTFFVIVSHPVHTILTLILIACSVSGICLVMGADFLGLLFIIVYVGAIAVLFLFVVMMIAVNLLYKDRFNPLNEAFSVLGFTLIIQMAYFFSTETPLTTAVTWSVSFLGESNLALFNYMLYSGFGSSLVVSSGLLLLISMIGSIFLTLQDYTTGKSQILYQQLDRSDNVNGYHNKYIV